MTNTVTLTSQKDAPVFTPHYLSPLFGSRIIKCTPYCAKFCASSPFCTTRCHAKSHRLTATTTMTHCRMEVKRHPALCAACGSGIFFPKQKQCVEMHSAMVSQHCELEPQVHSKMKSVRNVQWMWRWRDTMRPFFTPTSFLLFFHHGLDLWMKLNEAPAAAAAKAVMGMSECPPCPNTHTHICRCFQHTNTHRKINLTPPQQWLFLLMFSSNFTVTTGTVLSTSTTAYCLLENYTSYMTNMKWDSHSIQTFI